MSPYAMSVGKPLTFRIQHANALLHLGANFALVVGVQEGVVIARQCPPVIKNFPTTAALNSVGRIFSLPWRW